MFLDCRPLIIDNRINLMSIKYERGIMKNEAWCSQPCFYSCSTRSLMYISNKILNIYCSFAPFVNIFIATSRESLMLRKSRSEPVCLMSKNSNYPSTTRLPVSVPRLLLQFSCFHIVEGNETFKYNGIWHLIFRSIFYSNQSNWKNTIIFSSLFQKLF